MPPSTSGGAAGGLLPLADRTAVIVATYNWPEALELVVWGLAVQTRRPARVIIADDGSGPTTRECIERLARETGLDLVHVWHEDRGFRKSEILNRAVVAATEDYLIFTDGDVIPRDDFVATHLEYARPDRFLVGMTVRLPADVSARITPAVVQAGQATDLRWLRAQGFRAGRYALRFSRRRWWNTLLDALTPTPPRWRGGNASTWREHIIAVNGFDMEMGYGGQDAELGDRLENIGVRPVRLRFRTPTVHLHHERPWRDPAMVRSNREHRHRVREGATHRARAGIAELQGQA
jgi:glycosyltransferase involved in cell wall biosynthesis